MKSSSGFTLMEIIVVVVIISLMMGFAIPRLDSFLATDRSKKAERSILTMVRELRLKSRKLRKDHYLVISPSENRYWIESETEEADIKKINPGDSVDITGAQIMGLPFSRINNLYIRFYKSGYNDPFIVILRNRSNDKISTIMGHPFLYPPDIYDKVFFWGS